MNDNSRGLVALSLTGPDRGLLAYAAVAAQACGWTNVVFTHVVTGEHSGGLPDPRPIVDQMRVEVQREFSGPSAAIDFDVAFGPRIDQLIGLAVKHQADVILMGHRRQRSGRRSLARRLAMISPCSVWLVPEIPATISNVLVPTDFSSHSADALSVATSLAEARGLSECLAVHMYFDPSTGYDEHVADVLGSEEEAFRKFMASTDTHGIDVRPVFEESARPAPAILRVAEREGSDLIVMSTRGRSRSAAVFLGSVTSDTLATTTIPLLAVKHYGARMGLLRALLDHRFWESSGVKTN